MNVKIEITLTEDEYTEKSKQIQVQIEEHISEGFQNLDKWEDNVRRIGFQGMREMFRCGIELYEKHLLAEYNHKNSQCRTVRRGKLDFTIATAIGKVTFPRQRIFCKTCSKWITPLNKALGLHQQEQERTSLALQHLSSLCAINQPYRLATESVRNVTQDHEVISHQQIKLIVDKQGSQLRQHEEQRRKNISYGAVLDIMDKIRTGYQPKGQSSPSTYSVAHHGQFYIFLDGIWVRGHKGKGQWHEAKVGFLCTDEREAVGHKGRQRIPVKRYISSFESSEVLGSRVYAEALDMGMREYSEVFVLGDGARWIRNTRLWCFPNSKYILDWYHLHQKVCRVFRHTFPNDESLRRKQRKPITSFLWKGQKDDALKKLTELYTQFQSEGKQGMLEEHEGLHDLIVYVKSNWEGIVDYCQMQKDGYLIASTLVEGAGNIIVAKRQKKNQGMHWSISGADALCALRTLWLNDEWEDYWRQQRRKIA